MPCACPEQMTRKNNTTHFDRPHLQIHGKIEYYKTQVYLNYLDFAKMLIIWEIKDMPIGRSRRGWRRNRRKSIIRRKSLNASGPSLLPAQCREESGSTPTKKQARYFMY